MQKQTRFWLFFCFGWIHKATAMWGKKNHEWQRLNHDAPEQRFRANLSELFLDNTISGQRAMSLLEDAAYAGADGVESLLSKVKVRTLRRDRRKRKAKKSRYKNSKRDLLMRFVPKNHWPPTYIVQLPVFVTKTQQTQVKSCHIWLPHELVHFLAEHNEMQEFICNESMDAQAASRLMRLQTQWGTGAALACGLWIDGCPCNWDRTSSLEVMTLNFVNRFIDFQILDYLLLALTISNFKISFMS